MLVWKTSGIKWGGQRDSNPQQPEPQSGALPLSYGHHEFQILDFRSPIANRSEGSTCLQSWHKPRLLITCGGGEDCKTTRVGYRPARCFHEKNRRDFADRFFDLSRADAARAIGGSERGLSQSLHDRAAGRETRTRKQFPRRAGQVPFRGRITGGAAQTSRRVAAGDRGISQSQNQRKYFARRRQSRDSERF